METKSEEWRDIEGYEGYYQVSNFGRVRSVDRVIIKPHPRDRHPQQFKCLGKIIKTHKNRQGYISVCLKKNGIQKNFDVHRLVAKGFVEGYRQGFDVHHIDENKENNHYSNLSWVTRLDNLLFSSVIDRAHKNLRKPVLQMSLDGSVIQRFESIYKAHITLGIDKKSISGSCRQLYGIKTAGGYRWKFADE